jgi:hypothetical protein
MNQRCLFLNALCVDGHVFINVFGINIDPNVWSNLEKWDPKRMLNNES